MDTVTIPTKEYKMLLEAKRVVESKRRRGFSDSAFGVLKKDERLAVLQKLKGAWKHRKPDPIKELNKMRKEWERKLPSFSN